jgi:arabinose-5-phosphate isomerase
LESKVALPFSRGQVSEPAPGQGGAELVFGALELFSQTLGEVRLDPLQLDAALRLIVESGEPIVCTGVGKSGFIMAKMVASLNSLGIRAVYLNPTDALHGDLGVVTASSVVLLMSNSGTTAELVKLVPALRARGCHLIAVVGNRESALARASEVILAYGSVREVDEHGLAPTTSTVVQLAIADAVASAASRLRGFATNDFFANHPAGALGKRFLPVESMMRSGDRLPVVPRASPVTEALTTMTSKSIGCVCIVDDEGRLVGVLTDGDVRRAISRRIDLYEASVDDLMQKEPQVAMIGDRIDALVQDGNFLGRHFIVPVIDGAQVLRGVLVSIDLL